MKEMEQEQVLVRIKGVQRTPEGEENTLETEAGGRYAFRSGRHYVRYEETGLAEAGKVFTTLKFNEEKLTILRHGAMEQTMEFMLGKESRSLYPTPLGNLSLALQTEFFGLDLSSEVKKLRVEYSLALEGVPQSRNSLYIEIEPISW